MSRHGPLHRVTEGRVLLCCGSRLYLSCLFLVCFASKHSLASKPHIIASSSMQVSHCCRSKELRASISCRACVASAAENRCMSFLKQREPLMFRKICCTFHEQSLTSSPESDESSHLMATGLPIGQSRRHHSSCQRAVPMATPSL